MLFSYKWLQEYFAEDLPKPQDLVDLLITHSFEIESLEEKNGDSIIDVDILPNRAHDALCHYGLAREISAITGLSRKDLKFEEDSIKFENSEVTVKVSGDFCNRYIAREIKNIKVGPSPSELKLKLESIGQRSINNIVDITNIVMFELNQPMHAFDADKLVGNINVRYAKKAEKITTLDNQDIELDQQIPVIADDVEALAIAGVKGGKKAEVNEKTVNIVLESANFNSVIVRKNSQKIGIKTESSKRFENGITVQLANKAIARATELILKYASTSKTTICQSFDYYPNPVQQKIIEVDIARINSLIGSNLNSDEVVKILNKLKFEHKVVAEKISITVPFERIDLEKDVDIIEEIGRIYGYNNIADQNVVDLDFVSTTNIEYLINSIIRKVLIEDNFSEVFTYSFVSDGFLSPEKPIADDKKYLRPSLKEGILKSLEMNQKNADWLGLDQIKIFEIGKVFNGKPKDYYEKTVLGIGILNKLGIKKPLAGVVITEALKKLSEKLDIEIKPKFNEQKDNFVEIDLSEIYKKINLTDLAEKKYLTFPNVKNEKYKIISQYPFVLRDIAVWLPNEINPLELENLIKEKAGNLLVKEPRQFDVYKKNDKTSYAYRLVFQSYDKTLTDEEVNLVMSKVNEQIKKHNWEIR